MKLKRYEYTDFDGNGKEIVCGYTIKENVEPLGIEGEQLVETYDFTAKTK